MSTDEITTPEAEEPDETLEGPLTDIITVVVVDDHELVRNGFELILQAEDDIDVIGTAQNGAVALEKIRRLDPDIVLMDVQMPTMDGLEATARIVADTRSRVIILTTFDQDDYLFSALRAGASGFLLKNSPPSELIHAVREVANGNALLAPTVTSRVLSRFAAGSAAVNRPELIERLSSRERGVLVLVAQGLSNREIAAELVIGEATVKSHVSSILLKTDVRDRVQAVVLAYESGLTKPGE